MPAPDACTIAAVPELFGYPVPAQSLPEFLKLFGSTGHTRRRGDIPDAVHTLLQSISCRGAIMFGEALCPSQTSSLIAALAACKLPFHCAHGRPTTACLMDYNQARHFVGTLCRVNATSSRKLAPLWPCPHGESTRGQSPLKRRLIKHLGLVSNGEAMDSVATRPPVRGGG